jgi:hypothetical protein
LNIEEFTLSIQSKHKKHGWYVDSGCSKNMMCDKDRFLTLIKEIYGPLSFGNEDSTIIIGRGIVRFGNKDT